MKLSELDWQGLLINNGIFILGLIVRAKTLMNVVKKLTVVLALTLLVASNSGCIPLLLGGAVGAAMVKGRNTNAKSIEATRNYTNEYSNYRIELEKVNFEREKAGLAPITIPTFEEWFDEQPLTASEIKTYKKYKAVAKERAEDGGIESADVLTVSRRMALSILEVPEIMKANGVPRIALLPVKNYTRFKVNQNIFTERIRIELNKNTSGKMRFLARDRMEDILKERQAKRDQIVGASKEGDLLGVDFYLTGKLMGLSKAANNDQSEYVLNSFQLIDAETSDIIWEDSYEIKQVGKTWIVNQ